MTMDNSGIPTIAKPPPKSAFHEGNQEHSCQGKKNGGDIDGHGIIRLIARNDAN
jgi:hypothetical protein